MNSRFDALTVMIKKVIVDMDVFGLGVVDYASPPLENPGRRAFAFPRVDQKVNAFMEWLRQQEERGLLETAYFHRIGPSVEEAWTNLYIYDSYKRGVIRARQELKKSGYNIPTVDESGGIDAILGTPFHIDRVGLIFTRAFEQLRGITSQMDTVISSVLGQGMADGDSAAVLARKLIAVINGSGLGELGLEISYINPRTGRLVSYWMPAKQRAQILARTEIIRAHHMANIQEYKNWAAEGVTVIAEWGTAGDARVCEYCAGLDGKRFSLKEIEHMIPVHPQCRCIAIPIEVDKKGKDKYIYGGDGN
jgi:SPP1 gp7 family putative phage head morphogenesis protein